MNRTAEGKRKLPNVTLAAMTSVNVYETIRAMEYSMPVSYTHLTLPTK